MEFEDFKWLKLSEVINILNEKYNTFTGLEFEKIEKEVIAYNQKQAENYKGRDWVGIVFKDKVWSKL
jgi:hypothetical protein